jgi:tetratricopeptide (TPR) repeat protein
MSRLLRPILLWSLVSLWAQFCCAQVSKSTSENTVQHGLELARSGHCQQALSVLKRTLPQSTDKNLKRDAGLAGIHCAMVQNRLDVAEQFLQMLERDFPNDPEVLYTAVHTYSDLATRASQQLAITAPNSAQARELNAESLETQGKWDAAEKEYQAVVQKNPDLPGIHFRIGRLLLSKPNPGPNAAADAKKEFQEELRIDPSNAGAEYVLGELARQDSQWDEAISHFTRATQLDSGFGDAFLGLGSALMSSKKFSEAIPPLQAAVRLEPGNPGAHYNLATALIRAGREEEAEKEFAIHRQMTQKGDAGQGQQGAEPQNPN